MSLKLFTKTNFIFSFILVLVAAASFVGGGVYKFYQLDREYGFVHKEYWTCVIEKIPGGAMPNECVQWNRNDFLSDFLRRRDNNIPKGKSIQSPKPFVYNWFSKNDL